MCKKCNADLLPINNNHVYCTGGFGLILCNIIQRKLDKWPSAMCIPCLSSTPFLSPSPTPPGAGWPTVIARLTFYTTLNGSFQWSGTFYRSNTVMLPLLLENASLNQWYYTRALDAAFKSTQVHPRKTHGSTRPFLRIMLPYFATSLQQQHSDRTTSVSLP